MKRYLVYYDDKPINGLDSYDYVSALREAKLRSPVEDRKHIRIRLANKKGTLLWSLANQGEYNRSGIK